ARDLGLVIGEVYFRPNMMTADLELRAKREEDLRVVLQKAEVMGCRSVLILVGSIDESDHHLAPHPYMETDECKAEFREQLLRVLDGLELDRTAILIEPWPTTFFHQPEAIREFFDSLDHPKVGLHLDQMNMVSAATYFHTTELIETTFDLLGDTIGSAHLKDVRWDRSHMFMKFDEVLIG